MEELGHVLKNDGSEALVKIVRHSLCSKCSNKCQLAAGNEHEIDEIEVTVSNPIGASSGEMVKIEMGEQPLIMASLIIYLVPILGLILGYFAGQAFTDFLGYTATENAGIIGSILFLGLSFLVIKYIDRYLGKKKNYNPTIKEVVG